MGIQLRKSIDFSQTGLALHPLSSSKGLRKDYVSYSSKLSLARLSIKGKGKHPPSTVASLQGSTVNTPSYCSPGSCRQPPAGTLLTLRAHQDLLKLGPSFLFSWLHNLPTKQLEELTSVALEQLWILTLGWVVQQSQRTESGTLRLWEKSCGITWPRPGKPRRLIYQLFGA